MGSQPVHVDWTDDAIADLFALDDLDQGLGDVAISCADDVAHLRITGKALSERERTGNLSGFYRVKLDLPGAHPQRYRLIYRLSTTEQTTTVTVFAVGARLLREVYLNLMHRLEEHS